MKTQNLSQNEPYIWVKPKKVLFSEQVAIGISGLEPNSEVRLRARMPLKEGIWESWATYQADENGTVDTNSQAPIDGTYDGVDGTGLLWSMERTTETSFADEDDDVEVTVVELEASAGGETIAETNFERIFMREGVERTRVRERGLVADFYTPAGAPPYPTVICLGGSEGGLPPWSTAALLASEGYAVLSLAYFGHEGLPEALDGIRLEYFESAIDWLASSEVARSQPLGVVGWSRGAELALLLGSSNPEITTVVAYAPSSVVFEGIPGGWEYAGSAWQSGGEELPYVSYDWGITFWLHIFQQWILRRSLSLRPTYEGGFDEATETETSAASIPVENTDGPILLVSGGDDQMWPSRRFGNEIVTRLDEAGYDHPYDHLTYDGAGHVIATPYRPTTDDSEQGTFLPGLPLSLGGNPAGTATAEADSWPKVLEYLDRGLRNETRRSTQRS